MKYIPRVFMQIEGKLHQDPELRLQHTLLAHLEKNNNLYVGKENANYRLQLIALVYEYKAKPHPRCQRLHLIVLCF